MIQFPLKYENMLRKKCKEIKSRKKSGKMTLDPTLRTIVIEYTGVMSSYILLILNQIW